jgi:hypothetical protein
MALKMLPFRVLNPGQLQVAHIGLEGGMHDHKKGMKNDSKRRYMEKHVKDGQLEPFHADITVPHTQKLRPPDVKRKGFGGWGHPADQEHCVKLFELTCSHFLQATV